jgi:phosphoribosylamine--glycine ligase
VLGVTALGDDLGDARSRAYEAAGLVRFGGAHYRRDIAAVLP